MCEICTEIFNESENRGIGKSRGGLANVFLQERDGCLGGSWENFCCTWGAEPVGGAGKSRGSETP